MILQRFTENTAKFDDQIDLINQTLDERKPIDPAERIVYDIAKPVAKVVLYTKAIFGLFNLKD